MNVLILLFPLEYDLKKALLDLCFASLPPPSQKQSIPPGLKLAAMEMFIENVIFAFLKPTYTTAYFSKLGPKNLPKRLEYLSVDIENRRTL